MQDDNDHSWLKQGSTSSADVAKSYDDWAATYNETLAEWDYRAPNDAARMLSDKVAATAEILDAGCGTGLTGAALRGQGFSGPIDGIDLSPSSLVEAETRGVYRTLKPADFQKLPLDMSDNAYDGLICIGVLTYVPNSETILREFARLVRPGGTVLVTQREDLFRERKFSDTVNDLVAAGVFADAIVSEPQPYLPDNPDFGDELKVIYVTLATN
ncbi:MAG: class I SAM-dependent methyltransferase [Rhodospirillaceae bacterium]|jgi:predicted TPR repeat methyltransferase|nr:class I SAM-dependent methyltransferase [Rhodospirillaceae bacterium]MBT4487197.1 class I SAM-dependent methyltransferase [Rhodospirillaceae bacterium]MBT5195169.1 class I SAM-dependent methyltransferase [Rhodospirillaceae bacterium]MBT5898651.1 class I SAM-dependent methyltransferase [Rhodospirillaceae bacterium]MBT6429047.1 class I SAM-dependent methyltransferase [Rhodospirillaceae bacterium]